MVLGLLCALGLFSGCAAVSPRPLPIPPAAGLAEDHSATAERLGKRMAAHLERRYPAPLSQVHRLHLSFGGRSLLLNGYLSVSAPGTYRLLAQAEMGGTLFAMEKRAGASPAIVRNPAGLPRRWLLGPVARDIDAIYFHTPDGPFTVLRGEGGAPALLFRTGQGESTLFTFTSGGKRLLSEARYDGQEEIYRIDYRYTGDAERPGQIRIMSLAPSYQLTIQVFDNSTRGLKNG